MELGDFEDELNSYIKKVFKSGYNSTGIKPLIDFEELDSNFEKWVDKRVKESRKLQDIFVKTEMQDYLNGYLKEGKSFKDFRTDIEDIIDSMGVGKKGSKYTPHHIETIFHIEGQTAANFGRWKNQVDNIDVAPMWYTIVVPDNRHVPGTPCYSIAQHEEPFYAWATDPIWKQLYFPGHFGCRSGVGAIPKSVVKAQKIKPSTWKPNPLGAKGFNKTAWKW